MVDKIIITGVSGGVGKYLAKALQEEYSVVGIYNLNKPKDLQKVDLIKIDFSDSLNFFEGLFNHKEKIIFLHCAALSLDSLLVNINLKEFSESVKVNLTSAVTLAKVLIPTMMKVNFGRFIFMSSIVVDNPNQGSASYSISKKGLDALSQSISREYSSFGITSNVIKLGYFDLGLFTKFDQVVRKKILSHIPSKKFGEPEDIISTVRYIIKCEYLTGSEITLDGGMTIT